MKIRLENIILGVAFFAVAALAAIPARPMVQMENSTAAKALPGQIMACRRLS